MRIICRGLHEHYLDYVTNNLGLAVVLEIFKASANQKQKIPMAAMFFIITREEYL